MSPKGADFCSQILVDDYWPEEMDEEFVPDKLYLLNGWPLLSDPVIASICTQETTLFSDVIKKVLF